MVVIIHNSRIRDFIRKNGNVFIASLKKRKYNVERTWMTDKRGNKKICNVVVEFWDKLRMDEFEFGLRKYLNKSGFLYISDWLEEIRRLNKGKLPKVIYIYRVLKLGGG